MLSDDMRVLVLTIAVLLCSASVAQAGRVPMAALDAFDTYGAETAKYQGWDYVDRLATVHGDYRRAYATLLFLTNYDGTYDGKAISVPFEWRVEARLVRCGPGWYIVSGAFDRRTCPVRWQIPRW